MISTRKPLQGCRKPLRSSRKNVCMSQLTLKSPQKSPYPSYKNPSYTHHIAIIYHHPNCIPPTFPRFAAHGTRPAAPARRVPGCDFERLRPALVLHSRDDNNALRQTWILGRRDHRCQKQCRTPVVSYSFLWMTSQIEYAKKNQQRTGFARGYCIAHFEISSECFCALFTYQTRFLVVLAVRRQMPSKYGIYPMTPQSQNVYV